MESSERVMELGAKNEEAARVFNAKARLGNETGKGSDKLHIFHVAI